MTDYPTWPPNHAKGMTMIESVERTPDGGPAVRIRVLRDAVLLIDRAAKEGSRTFSSVKAAKKWAAEHCTPRDVA